mgnify:CR=1 FL=1
MMQKFCVNLHRDFLTTMQRLRSFAPLALCLSLLPPIGLQGQPSKQDSLSQLLLAHPQQDDRRAELLNGLAFLIHASQPEKTLAYANEVIGFAHKIKDKKFLAGAYTQKSIAHIVMSNLDSAKHWAEKALELERRTNHTEGIGSSMSNLGLIHYRLNNYPQALAHFQEAARLLHKVGHPLEVGIYLNMSSIYAEIKNFDKAKEYLQKVRTESKRTGNSKMEAYALLNLGTLYTEEADYERGRLYLDSALAANQRINDQGNIAKVYGNLAGNYSRNKDYLTSNAYHKQAMAINTRLHNSRSIAVNACGIGENYLMLDSLPLAYHWLSQSLQLGKRQDAIDVQRDASQHLSTYFEKTGRYDSALHYHRQAVALKDSIDNEANRKELTRLELQYDFNLKEQEYIQQQAINRLRIRQLWLYGVLVVSLLLVLGGYLLHRARTRSMRLRNAMREQELNQRAEALLLQQQLSESELKAIRSQMNPHFIFNVLNSIESYILENDARAASKLVQHFAKLTRLILENSTQSLVTAEREWTAVICYVELETSRFDHVFDYRFEVSPTLNLSRILLPPMLIQPLVENAILHGLRHVQGYRGSLAIQIGIQNDRLVITVEDNGIGLSATKAKRASPTYKEKSLGIQGIQERLALLQDTHPHSRPELHIKEITEPGKTGTIACLVLPLITAAEPAVVH